MSDNYQIQWERYRVRRRWIIGLIVAEFLAFFPFVGAAEFLSRKLFPRQGCGVIGGTLVDGFVRVHWVAPAEAPMPALRQELFRKHL